MMTHNMTISNPPECPVADLIRDRRKTVEGRVYDAKRRLLKVGDTIVFTVTGTGEKIRRSVTGLAFYESLGTYLLGEGVQNCLPDVGSFEEALDLYNTGGQSGIPWADPIKRAEARKETGYEMVAIKMA